MSWNYDNHMKCKPRKKHEFQLKNLKQKDEQKKN
jgi:hypothetical protein